MTKDELNNHKRMPKILGVVPQFRPAKRGKLPKPFHRIGGSRIAATQIIDVSEVHSVFFYYRNGEILTDTGFYGYLLLKQPDGSISPLFEFHWHPSHKGFHCKLPCGTQLNYSNRFLVQAPELSLKTDRSTDPRIDHHRTVLIHQICSWCGITIVSPSSYNSGQGELNYGTDHRH